MRHESHQQNLVTITKHLSSLNSGHMLASVSTLASISTNENDHISEPNCEVPRIWRTMKSHVQCASEFRCDLAIQDPAANASKRERTTPWHLTATGTDRFAAPYHDDTWCRSRQRIATKSILTLRDTITQGFFGTIITTAKTCVLTARLVDDQALDDDEHQYEHESSFKILPARWLFKLGFNYACNFSIQYSSTQGLHCYIRPINLVPDDALIFEFCRQGDIEKVRGLISEKLASVRDVDSEGRTALHVSPAVLRSKSSGSDLCIKFAAGSHHPELCKFLIDAGANRSARTFRPWCDSPFSKNGRG